MTRLRYHRQLTSKYISQHSIQIHSFKIHSIQIHSIQIHSIHINLIHSISLFNLFQNSFNIIYSYSSFMFITIQINNNLITKTTTPQPT